jgi:hypothetical protein
VTEKKGRKGPSERHQLFNHTGITNCGVSLTQRLQENTEVGNLKLRA